MSRRVAVKRRVLARDSRSTSTTTSTNVDGGQDPLRSNKPEVNILRKFFPQSVCSCDTCKLSGAFHSDEKPCWHGSGSVTGHLLKEILLRWVQSTNTVHRLRSIEKFNQLLDRKKAKQGDQQKEDSRSDIMQLQSIDELELFELIEVGQLKPQSKKLIQLAHQVYLWAWKVTHVCYEYFNLAQTAAYSGYEGRMPMEDFEKYSSHKKLYHTFRDMAGYLLIAALETCRTDILKVLDELNSRFNCPMAHLYMDDKCIFTWAEAYFHNFDTVYKNIWNGTLEEDFEKIALIEVTLVRGKLTFPGMPKPPVIATEPCAVCSSNKYVGSRKLFPLLFSLSRDVTKFPRQVGATEKHSVTKTSPSIVTVCQMNCELEVERAKHEGLDKFLTRYEKMSMKELLKTKRQKWTKQESKRFEIELSECREMLNSVDGVALRQFVLVGIPVRLEVQQMDEEHVELFPDIDVPGSNTIHIVTELKETRLFDGLSMAQDNRSGISLSKAAEKKYWEVNNKDVSLFVMIRNSGAATIIKNYQKELVCCQDTKDCQHTQLEPASFLFRMRWATFNSSLYCFSKTDFIVKLTPSVCPALDKFNPQSDLNLSDVFKPNATFCLIPINSGYIEYSDLASGVKFVISGKGDVEKLQAYSHKSDFLFFLNNLDLTTKTCDGGLLFFNGSVLIGVILTDAYNFLMEYSSLDKFVQHYNIYESSKFSLEEVLIKMNTSVRTRTDERLKKRGALEWKFGLLRLEFFRETRKQLRKLKQPVLPLPQTVYTVVIRISVPFYSGLPEQDSFNTPSKIKWICQCLGSLTIGQVFSWYRNNWPEADWDRFKFFYEKPNCGVVEPSVLISECKTVAHKDASPVIGILAEIPRDATLNEYVCTATQILSHEFFSFFRISLTVKSKQSTTTNKLLVPNTQSFADVLDVLDVDLKEQLIILLDVGHFGGKIQMIPPSANPDQIYEVFGLDRSSELIVTVVVGKKLKKEYLDRNAAVVENLLVFKRNHVLSVRDDLGDDHFNICPEMHSLLWHTRLIPEFDGSSHARPVFFDLVISHCPALGAHEYDIGGCDLNFVLGAVINNPDLLSKIISSRLVIDSDCYLASISPSVDPIRIQDRTSALLSYIQNSPGSMLLLSAPYSKSRFLAFLKPNKQRSALLLMVPRRHAELTSILKEEGQISGKILVMSNAVKEGMPFEECNLQSPCLCAEHLDIIQPIVYKINEELPISSQESEGPEGLMMICAPKEAKNKDLWKCFKAVKFIEFYACPWPARIGKLSWSEDKQFIIRFDSFDIMGHMRRGESGIATSYYAAEDDDEDEEPHRNQPDRRLSNYVFFAWQYDQALRQVVGMIPPKKQQIKAVTHFIAGLIEKYKTNMGANSATPAKEVTTKKVELKKNGDDVEEKVVQEQPSTKGQKKRLLNILDEVLSSAKSTDKPEVILESTPCQRCHVTKKNMLLCSLCRRAHFCNQACYKRGAPKHRDQCQRTQDRRNEALIASLK